MFNVDQLPLHIKEHIKHPQYEKDHMGMSDADIYIFKEDHSVLKVFKNQVEAKHTIDVMLWLNEHSDLSPKLIAHKIEENESYLLMDMLDGLMTSDNDVIQQSPEEVIACLVEGLHRLWRIPIDQCPFDMRIEQKLKIAKHHVDTHNVDVLTWDDDINQNRFHQPEEIYDYLVHHQHQEDLVFSHGDYCLPNVFIKNHQVEGLIDFGLSGIADRHCDIALCMRSIKYNFGSDAYISLFKERLGVDVDDDKIDYYLLLDELF